MNFTYIYALKDPKNNAIRYIGKADYPVYRYNRHLKDKSNTHKSLWIQKLLSEKLKPILIKIAIVDKDKWEFWEKRFISMLNKNGNDLTNGTEGGDSGPIKRGKDHYRYGKKMPESIKAKLIIANTGRKLSEEHKRKIGLSRKGIRPSDLCFKRLIEAKTGWNPSKETRMKMSIAKKGKAPWNKGIPFSEEARNNMSRSHIGQQAWNKGIHYHLKKKRKKINSLQLSLELI